MWRAPLLALILLGGCGASAQAVQLGARPTVFFDNLHAFPDFVFSGYGTVVVDGAPLALPTWRSHGPGDHKAMLFAVPRRLYDEAHQQPQKEWFSGAVPEVRRVGEFLIAYERNDMGGQIGKVLHYRVDRNGDDWSLTLVSEKNKYDLGEVLIFCLIYFGPLLLLAVLACWLFVFACRRWMREAAAAR